MNVDKIISFRD